MMLYRRTDANVSRQLCKYMIQQIMWLHVLNMHMHVSVCVCVCVCVCVYVCVSERKAACVSPGGGSWAERWSSAHGSVPTGSWGSSGGRPDTPPAAGAAVPAQTGPPSPRSASPVPARASTASHQSSAGRGRMFPSLPLHWSTTGRKKQPHTEWEIEKKTKNVSCSHKHRQSGARGEEGASTASTQPRTSSVSQGQVVRSRLRELRRVTQKRSIPLPSSGCTRKGGQRKWESICCLSGRAVDQSLLCSCTVAPPACVQHIGFLSNPCTGRLQCCRCWWWKPNMVCTCSMMYIYDTT